MGAFMYGANGEPTWYVSSASVSGGTLVSGPLQQYTGGQSLLGTWRSPTANAQSSGTMEFHLTAPNVGTLVLPNGVVVALTRFPFNLPPLTLNTLKSCPESTYVYDSTKLACLAGTQAVGKVDPTGEPCVMTFTTQGVALNSAAYSASYAGPYEDVSPGADFSFLYHDSHADAGASSMLLELIITSLSEQFQLEASLSPGSQDIYAKTSSQANAVTAPTNPLGQMTCRFTLN